MRWEEVDVKCCWMEKVDLGVEIVVEESMNLQVLHWPTPNGKVPQSGDDSWDRLLCTMVSRMFLLCRKETRGLLEKMAKVSGLFFKT